MCTYECIGKWQHYQPQGSCMTNFLARSTLPSSWTFWTLFSQGALQQEGEKEEGEKLREEEE